MVSIRRSALKLRGPFHDTLALTITVCEIAVDGTQDIAYEKKQTTNILISEHERSRLLYSNALGKRALLHYSTRTLTVDKQAGIAMLIKYHAYTFEQQTDGTQRHPEQSKPAEISKGDTILPIIPT